MAHVQIIPATTEHIQQLLPYVRQADHDEFAAFSGQTAEQVLTRGVTCSTKVWSGLIDGQVVTIFGVAPGSILSCVGIPWLVSSSHLETHQKIFLRRCKPVLKAMLSVYPSLENYVDARNHVAKAWLHWLGFRLEPAEPIGLMKLPFHHFTMRAK